VPRSACRAEACRSPRRRPAARTLAPDPAVPRLRRPRSAAEPRAPQTAGRPPAPRGPRLALAPPARCPPSAPARAPARSPRRRGASSATSKSGSAAARLAPRPPELAPNHPRASFAGPAALAGDERGEGGGGRRPGLPASARARRRGRGSSLDLVAASDPRGERPAAGGDRAERDRDPLGRSTEAQAVRGSDRHAHGSSTREVWSASEDGAPPRSRSTTCAARSARREAVQRKSSSERCATGARRPQRYAARERPRAETSARASARRRCSPRSSAWRPEDRRHQAVEQGCARSSSSSPKGTRGGPSWRSRSCRWTPRTSTASAWKKGVRTLQGRPLGPPVAPLIESRPRR
jgi:hypothetical protein